MGAYENPRGSYITKYGVEDRPVSPALNGVNPYQSTVYLHELVADFLEEVIVIDRRLNQYTVCGKGPKQS